MDIDPIARSVQVSVRELAVFRNRPASSTHHHQHWRATLGQTWHKRAEEQSLTENQEARFEVSIQANWRHRDWLFNIQGRIDQVLPSDEHHNCLREIKTIRGELPQAEETLIDQYPDHFAQAAIYHALAEVSTEFEGQQIESQLQFIDIESGSQQTITLTESLRTFFEQQLDRLIPFLEDRRRCRLQLQDAEIQPAFANLRTGQAELFATLHESSLQAKTVLLQAPTGFGKTGIVLEHALKQMQSGQYERCIYLTSKSTGQIETLRQLRSMIGDNLRYIQMRNRSEHRIDTVAHSCTGDERCDQEVGQRWLEADIHPPTLFQDGTVQIERAREIGSQTGVCPYALTKGCLPFAELWIGDTNYVFSPQSRNVFQETLGFDPARTLLIVDEAHNLPTRTSDNLSLTIEAADLLFAIEELRSQNIPHRLLAIAQEFARWIDSLAPEKALSLDQIYTGQDLCEDFAQQIQKTAIDYTLLAPFAAQLLWTLPELHRCFDTDSDRFLLWASKAGTLNATCLDSSDWIAEALQPFGAVIMMSATLDPIDHFQRACGLSPQTSIVAQGLAPWREDAYDVAIDSRVDTRLRNRDQYYATTARTVAQLVQHSPGRPVAVFFASYQYADNIRVYLEALEPSIRAQLQPRAIDLDAQVEFIEQGLLTADALFLILGSSYAEGVDLLGGRVSHVMVVGPALPTVNLIQKTKIEQHPSFSHDAAFRDVYIIPAMQRIHQALGRIVRAPGQKAKVLLHDKRFTESDYQEELVPAYQSEKVLQNETDLLNWLLF